MCIYISTEISQHGICEQCSLGHYGRNWHHGHYILVAVAHEESIMLAWRLLEEVLILSDVAEFVCETYLDKLICFVLKNAVSCLYALLCGVERAYAE